MTAPTIGAALTAAWTTVTLSPTTVALLATGDVPVAVTDLHGRSALRAVQVLSTAALRLRAAPQHWIRESRQPISRVQYGAALAEIDAAVAMLRQRLAARVGVQDGEVPRG